MINFFIYLSKIYLLIENNRCPVVSSFLKNEDNITRQHSQLLFGLRVKLIENSVRLTFKNPDDYDIYIYVNQEDKTIQKRHTLQTYLSFMLAQGSHLSRGFEGGESAGHSLPPPTIPAGPETRTRNLWVTSPTL